MVANAVFAIECHVNDIAAKTVPILLHHTVNTSRIKQSREAKFVLKLFFINFRTK